MGFLLFFAGFMVGGFTVLALLVVVLTNSWELVAWGIRLAGWLIVGALLVAVIGLAGQTAEAATQNPPCSTALPQPPLVVVLPDGTEVPATRLAYDLSARRMEVIGNDRVFCSGVED